MASFTPLIFFTINSCRIKSTVLFLKYGIFLRNPSVEVKWVADAVDVGKAIISRHLIILNMHYDILCNIYDILYQMDYIFIYGLKTYRGNTLI